MSHRLLHRSLPLSAALLLLVVPLPPAAAELPRAPEQPVQAGATGVLPAFVSEGRKLIRLAGGAFDPVTDHPPPVPRGMPAVAADALPPGEPAYWLVQVQSGRFDEALAAIETAGGAVSAVLAGGAYLVRATPVQRAAMERADAVRWTGVYQPGWKIPPAVNGLPSLLDLEGQQIYRVYVAEAEPDPAAVARAVASIGGVQVGEATQRVIRATASAAEIPHIAAIAGVEWIEPKGELVLHNANARWVNDTGVRDTYAATRPGRLSGAGQTAAVADTGINYVPDRNGRAQVYFSDCRPGGCLLADYTQATPGASEPSMVNVVGQDTTHRKMAAYFDIGGSGVEPSDVSAHGTHVAGSVTGDIGANGTWDREDGMAPGARLVHQNIATPGGGLSSPDDAYLLWQQAYRPRGPESVPRGELMTDPFADYVPTVDARTHNNSYGLVVPTVSLGSAEAADRFVWDHEDMVIVSSAGNGGPGASTMGAPSIGKNVISSGASANGRQPMSSADSMAIFSSHGPTGDGRIGVDLVTPGQIVVSPKGGTVDAEHYLQGTSMSGPVLTGWATLVREYFWEGYGPSGGSGYAVGLRDQGRRHNPSAALVRATLVNGAERMRGWYTGDDGNVRAADGQYPSAGQGFGLVQMHRSLYFHDAPRSDRRSWYHDVYRADEEAFSPTESGTGERTHTLRVTGDAPLSVTLAYTDMPNAVAQGTSALINDLDLVVTAPNGAIYVGNNFNTRETPNAPDWFTPAGSAPPDARNPVERVRIPNPEPGEWQVTVRAAQVMEGPQGFALAANGDLAPEGAFSRGVTPGTIAAGMPAVGDLQIRSVSADAARVTFSSDRPTTGYVEIAEAGQDPVRFVDHYNLGPDGYRGLDDGPVETSTEYAGRPMVTPRHEVLVTGLRPGATYQVTAVAEAAGGAASLAGSFRSTDLVYAPDARDIGQLVEGPDDPIRSFVVGGAGWRTGTQLYAGRSNGDGLLGAFMFRLPASVDPARVIGGAVEMISGHDLTNHYTDDTTVYVDLLDESQEPDWGRQTYTEIRNAPMLARTFAETSYRRGNQQVYPFTFTCADLGALRQSLATVTDGERRLPFRFDAETDRATSLFGAEFGFNRRSRGADLRPRLVLLYDDGAGTSTDPRAARCDPATPAPAISEVAVHDGITPDTATVSWRTDVPGDSVVLYRRRGETAFTQVRSPVLSTIHNVQVRGLDRAQDYEFAVRSSACNNATTTADNDGRGWKFFFPSTADVDEVAWFFHGTPADEAIKTGQFGGDTPATFDREEPASEPAVVQSMTGAANMAFAQNPLSAYWTGPYEGTLHGDFIIDLWLSGERPGAAEVQVAVFADPPASGVQTEHLVASGAIPVQVGTPATPARSTGAVEVRDGQVEVTDRLVIQIDSTLGRPLNVHYDAPSTPSGFKVPVAPPEPSLQLSAGPSPPLSAEAAGFNPAAEPTRQIPSSADVTAGTGSCAVAPAGAPQPPAPPTPPAPPEQPALTQVERIWGPTRVQTAVAISQRHRAAGSTGTVVVARADDYPDALAGAPLARRLDAPILLTGSSHLHSDTRAEIRRLGAARALLLGGSAALSEQVAADLRAMGVAVDRVGGQNRFHTAELVAHRLGGPAPTAFLAEGGHGNPARGWPDALSAAAYASHTGRPILLVEHANLPDETARALAALGTREAVVVGGRAAVSDAVFTEVAARGHGPRRLAGQTRYETSMAVHREAVAAGLSADHLWLATGNNWPDALSAGPTVARQQESLVLVDGIDINRSGPTRDLLTARRDSLLRVVLLGGRAAISDRVESQIRALVQ